MKSMADSKAPFVRPNHDTPSGDGLQISRSRHHDAARNPNADYQGLCERCPLGSRAPIISETIGSTVG